MSDKQELSSAKIEQGWRDTFSTENPFCPCNLKSFTKAVRWAERAMLQAAPAEPQGAAFRPTTLHLTGTITAREIAEATGLPLYKDAQGNEYIDSRDTPPEGVEYRGFRIGGSAGVLADPRFPAAHYQDGRDLNHGVTPAAPVKAALEACRPILARLKHQDGDEDAARALSMVVAALGVREPLLLGEVWMAFGQHEGKLIALPEYAAASARAVGEKVMDSARREGYRGNLRERLAALGWSVRRVTLADAAGVPVSHTDHPLRHYDRTCPACNPSGVAVAGKDQP